MNPEFNIHKTIIDVFAGNASEEQKKFVQTWINESGENEKLYNDLKNIWEYTGTENMQESYEVEAAIHRFRERIQEEKSGGFRSFQKLYKYAAVFFVLIAIPAIIWLVGKQQENENRTFTTVFSAYGDKTEVMLPDSSLVWLNSGSQLTFSNNFESDTRNVFLAGEAFFNVRKDPGKPFVVKAQGVDIEVLGTEFNLKAYPDEADVAVTLVEGSVQVSHLNQEKMIKPGQKLLLNKETDDINIFNPEDLAPDVEWIKGRLVFHNQSLADLELTLERWFDVEIEFKDEMVKTRRFSGTLERESILEVISYFGVSQYVDYTIQGNVITFFSENS